MRPSPPYSCLSIAAALEKVGGGSSLPGLQQLDTQIHHHECNADLAYPGVCSITSVYTAWNPLSDTKPNALSSTLGTALLFTIWSISFCHYLSSLFGGKAGDPLPCFHPVYLNNLVPLNNLPQKTSMRKLKGKTVLWSPFTYGLSKKGWVCLWLELHGKRMGGIGQLPLFLTMQQGEMKNK